MGWSSGTGELTASGRDDFDPCWAVRRRHEANIDREMSFRYCVKQQLVNRLRELVTLPPALGLPRAVALALRRRLVRP